MTNDEINVAIAEACGWVEEYLPNFSSDLNAMHKVVATLSRERYDAEGGFTFHLARIVHGEDAEDVGWNFYELQEATARQRAEAFLRTVGRWKEAP